MVKCFHCGKEFEPPPHDPRLTGCCIVFVCSDECARACSEEDRPYVPEPGGFGRMTAREQEIKMESRYCGKPLSEYTKEELISIIEHLESIRRGEQFRHERDMAAMAGLSRPF